MVNKVFFAWVANLPSLHFRRNRNYGKGKELIPVLDLARGSFLSYFKQYMKNDIIPFYSNIHPNIFNSILFSYSTVNTDAGY